MEPSEANQVQVDPNRVLSQLQSINANLSMELAVARAAVDQQGEMIAKLQEELAAKVEE